MAGRGAAGRGNLPTQAQAPPPLIFARNPARSSQEQPLHRTEIRYQALQQGQGAPGRRSI